MRIASRDALGSSGMVGGPGAVGRRLPHLVLALVFGACCGVDLHPPTAGSLGLAAPTRAMDRVHERLATGPKRLWAGAAAVDVTTDLPRTRGIPLGGFEFGRTNQGVRDPVFARALFLDDGNAPLVLVAVDNIGMMNDDVRAARALATDRWGDRVIVASTHDHVGPDTVGFWGCAAFGALPVCSGKDAEYMVRLRHGIAQAIDLAASSARPARLRTVVARADPVLSANVHNEIEHQKDDSVRILSLDGEDGANIAVVANWGCHAEALLNDVQLSADWPGVFYRRWAQEVGGVGIFVEGAQGGLVAPNPYAVLPGPKVPDLQPEDFPVEQRLVLRDKIGHSIFETVRDALKAAPAGHGPDGVTIAAAARRVELPVDNWMVKYMVSRGIPERDLRWNPDGRDAWMRTDVVAARLQSGGAVLADLVTLPGEPAPPFVAEVDATSSAPVKLNVALGNDEIGYILREADWDQPWYEYEHTLSLGRSTSTRLLEVVRELRAVLGAR